MAGVRYRPAHRRDREAAARRSRGGGQGARRPALRGGLSPAHRRLQRLSQERQCRRDRDQGAGCLGLSGPGFSRAEAVEERGERAMMSYLVVFIGAGIGGSIRHGMNIWVARFMGTHFPYHTLIINIVGSLVMGLVAGWFTERGGAAGHTRLFLATGILGGFTTFSAFSLDAVLLWERQELLLAALYVGGSVVGALAGLVLGLWIMRTTLG